MTTPFTYQTRRGTPKRPASPPQRGNPRFFRGNRRYPSNPIGSQSSYASQKASYGTSTRGLPVAIRGQRKPQFPIEERGVQQLGIGSKEQQKFQGNMSKCGTCWGNVNEGSSLPLKVFAGGQDARENPQHKPKLTVEEKRELKLKHNEEEQQRLLENISKWENYRAKLDAATASGADDEMISIEEWKRRKEESLIDPEVKRQDQEREERWQNYLAQQEKNEEAEYLKKKQERKAADEEDRILLSNGAKQEDGSGSDEGEEQKPHECPECGKKYHNGPKANYENIVHDYEMPPNVFLTKEFIANLPKEPLSCRDVTTFILRQRNDGFEEIDATGNNLMEEVERFRAEFQMEQELEKIPSIQIILTHDDLPKMRPRNGSQVLRPIVINGLKISEESSLAKYDKKTIYMYPIIETLLEMILMGHKTATVLPDYYECDVDDHGVFEKLIELGVIHCLKDCTRHSYEEQLARTADEIGAAVVHNMDRDLDSFCPKSAENPKMQKIVKEEQLSLMDQILFVLELIPIINIDGKLLHSVLLLLRFAYKEEILKEELEDFIGKNPPFPPPSDDNVLLE